MPRSHLNLPRACRTLLVFLIALVPAAVVAQTAPPDWLHLDSAEYQSLDDPVFGGRIAVTEAGPGTAPTVVLVHGLTDNAARDWSNTIPALAEHYHVIAPDLPGFGYSSKGNHLYSPDRLAQAVHAAVSQLASGPVVLVGHSLGGAVALSYAHQYPEDLKQLVLVDMAGVLHRSVYTAYIGMQGTRWVTGSAVDKDSWLGQLVTGVADYAENAAITPALLLHSATMRSQILGGRPETIAGYALVAHDFSAALWGLNLPTLLIWGDRDPLAPPRTGRMAAGVIPGARLTILDDVEHAPMWQATHRFNNILLRRIAGELGQPAYRLAPQDPGDGPTVSCSNQSGRRFTGAISHLKLSGCAQALVENANIGRLEVTGGSLRIVNSHIFDGINARHSRLTLTAGSVRGTPPLTLTDTAVDAAGTAFIGGQRLARNTGPGPVTLTLSVCRQQSAGASPQYWHDIVRIPAGDAE